MERCSRKVKRKKKEGKGKERKKRKKGTVMLQVCIPQTNSAILPLSI